MQNAFYKYRPIIINGIILLALIIAMVCKDGNVKDFFLGLGTGAALVNFGLSIKLVKEKENGSYTDLIDENN